MKTTEQVNVTFDPLKHHVYGENGSARYFFDEDNNPALDEFEGEMTEAEMQYVLDKLELIEHSATG